MKRTPRPTRPKMRIGSAIRKRREALEVSQEDFAETLDMHRTYYSEIERGLRDIRVSTLERIAKALKVRAWEVLRDAEA